MKTIFKAMAFTASLAAGYAAGNLYFDKIESQRANTELLNKNNELKMKIDSLENDVFQLETELEYSKQCDSVKNVPEPRLPEGFADRLIDNAKKLGKFHQLVIEED